MQRCIACFVCLVDVDLLSEQVFDYFQLAVLHADNQKCHTVLIQGLIKMVGVIGDCLNDEFMAASIQDQVAYMVHLMLILHRLILLIFLDFNFGSFACTWINYASDDGGVFLKFK